MSDTTPTPEAGPSPAHGDDTEEAILTALAAELNAEDMIESDSDLMHLFMGLLQAIQYLGAAEDLVPELRDKHAWFGVFWQDPDLHAAITPHDTAEEKADHLADIEAWVRSANAALLEWLFERGMPAVRLWVWLSCHQDFGLLKLDIGGKLPELILVH